MCDLMMKLSCELRDCAIVEIMIRNNDTEIMIIETFIRKKIL